MAVNTGLILFVDDDELILKGYRRRFRNSFNMMTAIGGHQGIKVLNDHQFAVIVSDVMMPEIDGFEFLKVVRVRQPSAIRIILSGSCDEATLRDALTSGLVHGYVEKGTLELEQEIAAALKAYEGRTRR